MSPGPAELPAAGGEKTLTTLRKLWNHRSWADELVLEALSSCPEADDAWREYDHVLGAEETWRARLERREPRVSVWPELSDPDRRRLRERLEGGYGAYLDRLDDAALAEQIAYTNSDGRSFETRAGDMLLQVFLHGHYHRGKVNLMLRERGCEPAEVDFIGFVRGVPAARTTLEGR